MLYTRLRLLLAIMLLASLAIAPSISTPQTVSAQGGGEEDLAEELLVEINSLLIEADEAETLPLARNETLDAVAQQIADELGEDGTYVSVPPVLADEEGYPRWPDNSQRVISDPYQFIGVQTPAEVATLWNEAIIDTIAISNFREIGIGVSTYVAVEGGTEQDVFVIVLGAQPNVIPVVVNEGSSTIYDPNVELYLHNEYSLAYFTDDNVLQRIQNVRIASSEEDLDDADLMNWEDVSFGYEWEFSDEFGEKSVWVEMIDTKGLSLRTSTTVEYADPDEIPEPPADPEQSPVTLVMTYSEDTFTLQIETERSDVRLQEVFFTWLEDQRAYELENADNLSDVDLEEFNPNECIQIRLRSLPAIDVEGCETVYLEANEFTELDKVFWNPDEFESFTLLDGPRELGTCDTAAGSCEIQLLP